jgi:hypothetical protein
MASKGDYIPRTDADFNSWLTNFLMQLNAQQTSLGVSAAELSALQAAQGNWDNAYDAHQQMQMSAASTSQSKQAARESLEDMVRATVQRIQTLPTLQDSTRALLGITVRATTRTPAPAPTTRPVAQVDTSQRLRHTIIFTDETTPNSRAKPGGARGCEIHVKIGDTPAGPSDLNFLALDTASPYVAVYDDADAGKVAHYMLRWVNSRGDQGPWSQTISATITA